MRIAALDVGSNSFHMLVAEVSVSGRVEILDRAKEMVRLGESTLRTGLIPPELFRRGIDALKSLRRIADRHQPDALVAVATSAVREAQNGGEFARAVLDEVGIDIQVIGGHDEARLIYLGARGSLDLAGRRVALFDVGGGSTEVIVADARECYFTDSLKVGVLRLRDSWEALDPPTPIEVSSLADRVRRTFEPVMARVRAMGFDFVAFTSGTALALGALTARSSGTGNGGTAAAAPVLRYRALVDLIRRLTAMTSAERAENSGLDARRVDTIVPGAIVLRTILELAGVEEATLCEPALREGIVADFVARNRPGIQLVEEFPDLRRRSVMELARRCRYPDSHSHHVARLALSLFHQTRELHGLSNSDAVLLEYAALLHDIGLYISSSRHHRHGHYLISTSEMRGFSDEEVQTIALAVRYHRKAVPKKSHIEFAEAPKPVRRKVRVLAALLRVADALDRTHAGAVRAVRCTVTKGTIELRLESAEEPELETWAGHRKGDLLENLFGRRLVFVVDPPALEKPEVESATSVPPQRVAERRAPDDDLLPDEQGSARVLSTPSGPARLRRA
jgi:exopolyphosphatase/guanosine-5'-triphosphate,3'-diphosphate pyrophosphatase